MGHFGGRPREGERPGSNYHKLNKERERGRIVVKSPQKLSISERKRRLDDLEKQISHTFDPQRREPLYEQYANLAASCPPEVFVPEEIRGIERHSVLSDNERLSGLDRNQFQGPRADFLPLHHIVKVLSKPVPNELDGKYIYLLGNTSTNNSDDTPVRNLRGLEYFLLSFARRIPQGQILDVQIDRTRVQVPSHNEYTLDDRGSIVIGLRRQLRLAGINQSDRYHLRRIRDGNHKIGAPLDVITEQPTYITEGRSGCIIITYATIRT